MDILQALQNQYTQSATLSSVISEGPRGGSGDIVPPIADGAQVLSQSITLADAAHKVLAKVTLWGRSDDRPVAAALFRGTVCIDARHQPLHFGAFQFRDLGDVFAMSVLDAPSSAGPHVYSVRVGVLAYADEGGGVMRLNGTDSGRLFGGASKCTLTLLEIG